MKVCITRNAEIDNNAGLIRIVDAISETNTVFLVTRNRHSQEKKINVKSKRFIYNKREIENIEINIKADSNSGLKNFINLIIYQLILVYILFQNRKKYDIIHSFDLDTGLVVNILSKLIKNEYIYHIADFYVDSRKGMNNKVKNFIRKAEFHVIKHAHTTIVCTEERINQIAGSMPKNTLVIHNTPSINIKEKKVENSFLNTVIEPIEISYIGSLSETRFIKELVYAVKRNSNYKLNIGGIGHLDKWVKNESEGCPNIHYLGKLKYEETFEYYTNCDIMVAIYDPKIPNHKFSAPNKVYEAMVLGKPIIVAKETGLGDIIYKNDMGYLIEYSLKDFDNILNYLVENKEELLTKGLNAKHSYKLYSWEVMKERLNYLYSKML